MARPGRARPHGGAPPHQDRRVAGTGGTPGPHVGHERPSRRADVRVDRGASDASTRQNGLNLNGRELGNADAFGSAPAEKDAKRGGRDGVHPGAVPFAGAREDPDGRQHARRRRPRDAGTEVQVRADPAAVRAAHRLQRRRDDRQGDAPRGSERGSRRPDDPASRRAHRRRRRRRHEHLDDPRPGHRHRRHSQRGGGRERDRPQARPRPWRQGGHRGARQAVAAREEPAREGAGRHDLRTTIRRSARWSRRRWSGSATRG
jgi:hypothetical protein